MSGFVIGGGVVVAFACGVGYLVTLHADRHAEDAEQSRHFAFMRLLLIPLGLFLLLLGGGLLVFGLFGSYGGR